MTAEAVKLPIAGSRVFTAADFDWLAETAVEAAAARCDAVVVATVEAELLR